VERGVGQLVVLGAGLDTYAYRGALAGRLRIFEVDHPATQVWKRERLADAAISLPPGLTFAPIDFENQTLSEGLAAAGFDPVQQTFFTWLGVVPYLTEEAVWATLEFISSLPAGAHVVFDYSDPPESFTPELRDWHERRAAHVAALGEGWINYLEPQKLHAGLTALGFTEIEDLGPREIAFRYFPNRMNSVPERGGHVLRATTMQSPQQ
jgi:methyltransferase (TIGR00027 family)